MKALGKMMAVLGGVLVLAGCAADVREVKMQQATILHTNRDEAIYVDVRNSSSVQDFQIEGRIREKIRSRGYKLVEHPDEADVELRVLVVFCGLEKEAFEAGTVVAGGLAGAGAGALGGVAAEGGGEGAALGALIGAILGAGAGAATEYYTQKNTFTGLVQFEVIIKKGAEKGTIANSVAARVRQRKITLQGAADMIAEDVGNQIGGLF